VRRRNFITMAGGAALWPMAARAQQPIPVIGFLSSLSPENSVRLVAAFREALRDGGYVEGRNVAIEFRWARGQYEKLPAAAAELVALRVAVIVATGGQPVALAAKAATSTIPIVFGVGGDPVKDGLVASMNRPGGNATGVNLLTGELEAKRLGLLKEVVPKAALIAMLLNQKFLQMREQRREVEEAARTLRLRPLMLYASTDAELDTAFGALEQQRPDALLVASDPFFEDRRARIVAAVDRLRLPAIYQFRQSAVIGGLMTYGISLVDVYRKFAYDYVVQILNGAKPADLPVQQPTKFELVINLKTAKALGITVPESLLVAADEVIE
jgi:putative ABC transport system substrate-binding protein